MLHRRCRQPKVGPYWERTILRQRTCDLILEYCWTTALIASRFAQAWRKRTTVPYTRAIGRACQMFSQQPEHSSDLMIEPLVQLSELMCRISDHFSYDNIEDSEVNGEISLEISTSNFSTELHVLRNAMPASVRQNSMCISTWFD